MSVDLDFPDQTRVDAIKLVLRSEQTLVPDPRTRVAFATVLAVGLVELSGEARLPKGTSSFRARFELPADAPPTYIGHGVRLEHSLELDVVRPWWPDLTSHYELRVQAPPGRREPPLPRNVSTARGDDDPFIELTVDDINVAPGDHLTGAVAVANLRGKRCRGVRAALVGVERLGGHPDAVDRFGVSRPSVVREGQRYGFPFLLDVPLDGKSGGFRLRIPEYVTPAFRIQQVSLAWHLELIASMSSGSDVVARIPISLRALIGAQPAAARVTDVGTGRWRATWGAAGAAIGLSLDGRSDLELSGSLSGLSARVFPDPTSDVPAIAIDLSGFDWGLGLRVSARRIRLFGGKDEDGFGKRYRVEARDPKQVSAALARPLRRELLQFDDVHLDDHALRVRAITGSFDHPQLGALLGRLPSLAAALERAIAEAPPPPLAADALPAYRGFSAVTGARLVIGSLAVVGASVAGASYDLETRFEGAAPAGTRITLALDPPLIRPFDARIDADVAALPGGAREVLRELLGAGALEVEAHALHLDLGPFVTDPETLRPLLTQLAVFARRLRGYAEEGPYR